MLNEKFALPRLICTLARLLVVSGVVVLATSMVLAQNNDQIVYASGRDGAHQLYVMDADGTHAHALTSQGDNTEPSWSPDRRTIAFTSDNSGISEIYVINSDGSSERPVTNGGGYSASWSPDGQRLAFISDRTGGSQLYVTDTTGSNLQQLTTDPSAQAAAPAWSPNDKTIAFVYDQNGLSAIWLINTDGSNLRRLTHDPTGEDYGTAWAPDGQHLAYTSTVSGDSDLLMVDANGTNEEQIASLTGKYADDLTWSPDGTKLAFTAWARRAPRAIFVVAANGSGNLSQLSQGSDDAGWPSWASPQLINDSFSGGETNTGTTINLADLSGRWIGTATLDDGSTLPYSFEQLNLSGTSVSGQSRSQTDQGIYYANLRGTYQNGQLNLEEYDTPPQANTCYWQLTLQTVGTQSAPRIIGTYHDIQHSNGDCTGSGSIELSKQ